jgi:hypothetical protein
MGISPVLKKRRRTSRGNENACIINNFQHMQRNMSFEFNRFISAIRLVSSHEPNRFADNLGSQINSRLDNRKLQQA